MENNSQFIISDDQLKRLEQVATRLYSEERMSGDDMRNAAQRISGIVNDARQLPI